MDNLELWWKKNLCASNDFDMFFLKSILNISRHMNHTKWKKVWSFPSNHYSFVLIVFLMWSQTHGFHILLQLPLEPLWGYNTKLYTDNTYFMKLVFDGPPSCSSTASCPCSMMLWLSGYDFFQWGEKHLSCAFPWDSKRSSMFEFSLCEKNWYHVQVA